MQHYYINNQGIQEGPLDLVTIMRRIRVGKIGPDTLIHVGDAPAAPAKSIEDIALFFSHDQESADIPADRLRVEKRSATPNVARFLAAGWSFTMEHNIMTVYAGTLLLLCLALGSGLINAFGPVGGSMLAWTVFILLHNIYFIFILRLYRGQTLGSNFINMQLGPILGTLSLFSVAQALMLCGGTVLLIVPAIIVMLLYALAPFLIIDHQYSIVEAMQASRLLVQKDRWKHAGTLTLLVSLHLLCMFFLLPVPLTLPLFAAALCAFYEELSNA